MFVVFVTRFVPGKMSHKAQVAVDHWQSMKTFIQYHIDELNSRGRHQWLMPVIETTKIFLKQAEKELELAQKELAVMKKYGE